MPKVSHIEVDDMVYEDKIIDELYELEDDVVNWEKNQDFDMLETSINHLPEGVTVKHEWLGADT